MENSLTIEKVSNLIEQFRECHGKLFDLETIYLYVRETLPQGPALDHEMRGVQGVIWVLRKRMETLRKHLWSALIMAVQTKASSEVQKVLADTLTAFETVECYYTVMERAEEMAKENDTYTMEDLGL